MCSWLASPRLGGAGGLLGRPGPQGRQGLDELSDEVAGIADGHAKVGYLFATWAPTGETRNYDAAKGEFGRTKILNPITAGGTGGFVLGLRYDYADLGDAYTTGKSATNLAGKFNGVTAGVTYYPISYVRFMLNYTDAKIDNPVANSDVNLKQLQLRAQVDF